jgi:hypothetical protein
MEYKMQEMALIGVTRTKDGHYICVKFISECGILPTKYIRLPVDERAVFTTAKELQRDFDSLIFGEDWRWLDASTPRRSMHARWNRIAAQIESACESVVQ